MTLDLSIGLVLEEPFGRLQLVQHSRERIPFLFLAVTGLRDFISVPLCSSVGHCLLFLCLPPCLPSTTANCSETGVRPRPHCARDSRVLPEQAARFQAVAYSQQLHNLHCFRLPSYQPHHVVIKAASQGRGEQEGS